MDEYRSVKFWMALIKSSKNVIGQTLEGLPFSAIRQLTILNCGKLALYEADRAERAGQTEAWDGALNAAMAILGQLEESPTESKRFGRLDGIRLRKQLFKPIKGLPLSEGERLVYQAALNTAECQMRDLHDSDRKWPDLVRD